MRKFLLMMLVGLFSISIFGQGTIEIGTGTLTNGTIVHPTPYGTYYKNHRVQYLYLASELSAAGLLAGDITALAFNVENPNTCSDMPNFTIKGKLTTDNVLTTTFDNGTYTTLFTTANYLPTAGWNTHTFTTSITWDGTSNLLIDVCFDIIPGSYTENASVFYTVTSTNLASSFRSDSTPACGTTSSATTSVNRANIRLTGTVASCLPPSLATVVASNYTTTGVTLSWTDITATSWNAELYLASAVYGVDAPLQTANNLSATTWNITGLTTLTDYKVYFQSNCGANGLSIFVGPYNFSTPSSSLFGTYTINSALPTSSTNFANFTDFSLALNSGGISSSVIVNVEPNSGPYVEQVSFGQILNSSATNTVTINGNGNTLQFLSTNTDERATLKLNGASYVTVNNLIIKALGEITGEFGWAVWLTNNANYNTFDNCEFHASTTATATNFAGFITSNSATGAVTAGLAADYLTIKNSKSIGGYYGIVVNGPTSAPFSTNNLIENNELLDFHMYGLYLRGQNNSVFTDNIIGRPTRTTTGTLYMLYITQDMSGSKVENNIINNFSPAVATTSSVYGVYGTTISATAGQELLIANNLIYGMQNLNGTQYGLYMLTTNNTKFYHNTISMDNTSHTGSSLIRAFHHSGNLAEIELVNNIFSVTSNSTGTKYCLYFAQTLANIPNLISNGNVLHMGATAGTNHIAYWNGGGGPSFTTLLDWQSAGGGLYDQNSVNADPLFTAPLLTPEATSINNIGSNLLAFVPTDIFGIARTATPDPGAIEFNPPSCQQPTDLLVDNITLSTAELSWTSAAANFNIEIGLLGFTPGTGNSVFNTIHNAATYLATGLATGAAYEYYVRAICSPGDSSSWAGPIVFTTPITGTFTINSALPTGGTNFESFTDIANVLTNGGLAGPVIINVEPNSGPYVEQVVIGELFNSSPVNTITINGNGETLEFLSTTSANRATLKFDGTDYVEVNNLVVKALGSTASEYGWAVWLANGADYITFDNCEFHSSTTSTSTNYAGFVTSNSATGSTTSGLAADYLTVKNSKVIGGYHGLIVNGPTSAPFSTNNLIENNEILDFHMYGLYLRGQNNSVFTDNIIGRPTRTTTGTLYMLYITQDMSGSKVENNIINNFSPAVATTSTIYGVYGTTISATVGQELLIANNVIYGMQNLNGTQYGLYMLTTNNTKFYHNTISMDNTSHTGSSLIRAFHHSGNLAEIELVNNIFSVTSNSSGTKYCIYFAQTAANAPNLISNGNVLHMGATAGTNHIAYWSAISYTTLADWQLANTNAYDQNSVNEDPLFVNPLLTPESATINNIGTNLLTFVPTDIFGIARTATPDPGAIEFNPPSCLTPIGLSVANVDYNSADLTWISTAASFEVEVGAVGFTPGTGTSIASVINHPTNTWSATGLSATSDYSFYVRAICAVSDSSTWAGPFNFTTACGPFTPDYTEDFESATFPPMCWDRYEGLLTANSTLTSTTSGWFHHVFGNLTGDNNSTYINVYSTKNHWLVTPTIDLGTGTSTYRLEFDMALTPWTGQDTVTLGSTDTIAVVISTDNGVTWSDANVLLMLTENNTISNIGENVVIQLDNYTGFVRIGFYASRPTGLTPDLRFYVDNVSVLENIVITDATITPDSVTFIVNEPANLETFVTWNSATAVTSIVDDQATPYTLTATDYSVAGNAITLNQSYLTTSLPSAGLTRLLTINFDLGNPVVLTIGSVTTVDVNELENNIVIYPNPSNGQFSIIANDTYMMSIYDISGRLIQVKEIYSGTNEINMLNNASGVYTIKIMNNKHSNSFRIVVQ